MDWDRGGLIAHAQRAPRDKRNPRKLPRLSFYRATEPFEPVQLSQSGYLEGIWRGPEHDVQVGLASARGRLFLSSPRGGTDRLSSVATNTLSRQGMSLFVAEKESEFRLVQQFWDGYSQYSSVAVSKSGSSPMIAVLFSASYRERLHNRMFLLLAPLDEFLPFN